MLCSTVDLRTIIMLSACLYHALHHIAIITNNALNFLPTATLLHMHFTFSPINSWVTLFQKRHSKNNIKIQRQNIKL